ncbi:MAG: hypothetical protein H7125_13640 [Proteobacteria bacterium]|nr:hypothetical protein [Burkholderiales bacterium]
MRWSIVAKLDPHLQRHSADDGNVEVTFAPQDRIEQLTMRNLDFADRREKLATYAWVELIAPGTSSVPRPDRPVPAG